MMRAFNELENIDIAPDVHERALRTLLATEELGRVFIAEVGGSVVGYAVLTFNYDLEYGGRDAFLTEVFLTLETRGHGQGRALLRSLERAAHELDVKAIHLLVRPENAVARRLYASAGYTEPARILLGKSLV
jgi:ribosomal protein S18 acetylase RimI-like enzyme